MSGDYGEGRKVKKQKLERQGTDMGCMEEDKEVSRFFYLNPASSREDQLEKNTLAALEAVPLKSMRKFANRSRRFMDAYDRGLNGRQAAWAARKYRGHRILPEGIMLELDKEGVK